MQTRQLGRDGPTVSALGLGCMGMSDFYGPADEGESLATIDAALDAGITLFDTGDFYGSGHNEMLVGRALKERRDRVFLQVKFGALRDPTGGFGGYDNRPVAIRNFLAYSLKRLGTDHIDLYMPSRVDPNVPIEDVIGALADLKQAGWIRHIGLSEAGADSIRRAHAVHPITALQIEYSLMSRGIETDILPTCRELGIGVTAYGVLARGLLGGHVTRETLAANPADFRGHSPRFQGENLDANLQLVDRLRALAAERNVTPAQLAVAWGLHRGEDVVPLVGARRRERLTESLAALDIVLSPDDLASLEAAVPANDVQGGRYPAAMGVLDSEKDKAA